MSATCAFSSAARCSTHIPTSLSYAVSHDSLDDQFDTLLNPTVIVEVLSPTTESYDRGKKFGHYRRLESLKEYVLVAQDEVLVERYLRQGEDWLLTDSRSIDDTLSLTSIDCHVPLREIYARIEFPSVSPTKFEP